MANLATVDVQKIKLVFKRFHTETFVRIRRIEGCLQAFYTVENFRARTLFTKFFLYFVTTLATLATLTLILILNLNVAM